MVDNSANGRRKRRGFPFRAVISSILIIIALALAAVYGYQELVVKRQTNRDLGTPVWTPTPSATNPTPSLIKTTPKPKPSPKVQLAAAEGCSTSYTALSTPTRFQIPARGVDAPMMSLGLDSTGAPATPPKDQPNTVAWYDEGPKVSADKGKAVLTAHTYRNGGALGNLLYEPKTGLKPGDIIKISDATGNVQCFEYKNSIKVWVDDYDPNSDILYDWVGKPEVAIVVCWDFDAATEDWGSRIIFYADPLVPASA